MVDLIASLDWASTPLGPREQWPQALRQMFEVILQIPAPVAIYWGPELILLYNDHFRRIIGRKHPDALGSPGREVFAEIWDEVGPKLQRVLDTGRATAAYGARLPLDRGGEVREAWFDYTFSPIPGGEGGVGGVLNLAEETTKRHQMEEALRASEARYRGYVEATSNSVYRMSADGKALLEVTGSLLPHHDASTGRARDWIEDYVHPDDRSAVTEAWRAAVAEASKPGPGPKSVFRLEHRALLTDGSWGWVMCRAAPVRDRAGALVEWVGTATDIDDRRAAQAALQRTEERIRRALEIETVGIVFYDMRGRILDANDAFLRMYGYAPSDLGKGGLTWKHLTPDEGLDVLGTRMEELRTTGRTRPYERRHRCKDGSPRWVLSAATRLGETECVEFVLDITDRKESEREREALVGELNHRVKNSLMSVLAISAQTAQRATSLEEFQETFQGRILALARGHDMVTRSNWRPTPVGTLIERAMAPYQSDDGRRVKVTCDDTRVVPQTALALTSIVHELATNSAKYGALSDEDGRIEMMCELGGESPRIRWVERGGPPIESPPERTGFGTRMIEGSARHGLGGDAELEYRPEGLVATLEISPKYLVKPGSEAQ